MLCWLIRNEMSSGFGEIWSVCETTEVSWSESAEGIEPSVEAKLFKLYLEYNLKLFYVYKKFRNKFVNQQLCSS